MNQLLKPTSEKASSLTRVITFAFMVFVPIVLVLSAGFLVLGIQFEHYLYRPFVWIMGGLFALMAFFWRLCIQGWD